MKPRAIAVTAIGELVATAALVAVVFAAGTIQVQLGAGTIGVALLGSLALGLGYAAVVWTFGRIPGAQTNPLISIIAAALGGRGWARTLILIAAQVAGALIAAAAIAPIGDVSRGAWHRWPLIPPSPTPWPRSCSCSSRSALRTTVRSWRRSRSAAPSRRRSG